MEIFDIAAIFSNIACWFASDKLKCLLKDTKVFFPRSRFINSFESAAMQVASSKNLEKMQLLKRQLDERCLKILTSEIDKIMKRKV